ncbi:uncharacterized protein LOC119361873 [Triticum dicoccoides]|uniref:Dirigent protein n=1 Tax=Triticum turgidum subsp. durum TaxID=4567 RepID=A0A9R1PBY3_TRITD|nr:uncharacterized protein LOC119361873 [Triticum dicoccoides]VAH40566.1 unnamed protein product [Triticum turgidum subsp. durum]
MAKYVQSAPVSNEALQHKEFLLDSLYMEQRTELNTMETIILDSNLPQRFGCIAATDYAIYDGIGLDKKLVARAQGLNMAVGATNGTWSFCFNMVFVDERFTGSSLKVLGNLAEPYEGEWAILGGTGEFAYAQGVVTFKKIQEFENGKSRLRELQIRAVCVKFSSSLSLPVKMGPWGGNGGSIQDMTTGKPMRLESVTIHSDNSWIVYSLAFTYIDKLGKRRKEGPWGPDKGTSQTIEFGPKEYVREISGTIDTVISSLVITTNFKKYGPFGHEKGNRFSATVPENTCVVGFFARTGNALDAIGIYHGPIVV